MDTPRIVSRTTAEYQCHRIIGGSAADGQVRGGNRLRNQRPFRYPLFLSCPMNPGTRLTQNQNISSNRHVRKRSSEKSLENSPRRRNPRFLRFPASITNFRNRGIIEIPSFRPPRHTDDQTMESQQLPETGVTREMFRLSSQYLTKPEKERRLLDSAGYRHQHW